MMLYILSFIEILFQTLCGLGIFIEAYGTDVSHKKWTKWILVLFLILDFDSNVRNNTRCLISTSAYPLVVPIITLWLWAWTKTSLSRVFAWTVFYKATGLLLKMPVLILGGIVYGTGLGDTNLNPYPWEILINIGIIVSVHLLSRKYRKRIISFLRQMLHQRVILSGIGVLEFAVVIYLMNLGAERFSVTIFIMACVFIICLLLAMILSVTTMEYQLICKNKQMMESKESSLRENYTLLNQEIERNRKMNHDRKHDFSYLYDCFLRNDYESGIQYIETKNAYQEQQKQKEVWTGHGGIDFLLNKAKQRAEALQAKFYLEIDLLELPMAEYDIFYVLGNLLDNAIEAIEKCDTGNRFINIKMMNKNNVFQLYIENSYKIEPQKKGKKFLSTKDNEKNEHGWGIENVKEIVERYKGILDIYYENQRFCVDLVILK
ncbi:MAG: GHKL domain-containing protein [Lachnospiraceae bacterium]|nr:GHKL domain-containing protein [Lachnospiraceae bacterium]